MRKTVLVTGASRGIGEAIALKYALNGYHVIANASKDIIGLMALKTKIKEMNGECYPILADVSDYQGVKEMLQEVAVSFPHIDVLINNAGISHYSLMTDTDIELWHRIINTNLSSAFYLCHEVVPMMLAKGSGAIIDISSIWGIEGASMETVYSASKGGMNAFTKALAKELGPSHIRVNAIACGAIDTDMNSWLDEDEKKMLIEEIPLCAMGTPEQVAELTYFLGSPKAAYLTGEIIRLSGGF